MLCCDGAQHFTILILYTNSWVFTPTSPVPFGVQLTFGLRVAGQGLWGGEWRVFYEGFPTFRSSLHGGTVCPTLP